MALQAHDVTVFCKECYKKYENFIVEKTVEANHTQNYDDIKSVK